ncbi:helix-turn-helix domain-containing protein [Kitasatospora sp. NPDC058444]|uniref:helix-turn-helix domain-containing protein n=1 Tax=Kitasatospora sp. NPDC058444 TaxID=3346504 RepID=UPI00364BB42F
MSTHAPNEARVIPLRPHASPPASDEQSRTPRTPARREPLWRDVVGDVLRRERLAQERTLKDVAEAARISMPYLSELERGRKEASSEVLAAAARALGLGLADLLSLAQDELARYAPSRTGRAGLAGLAGRGRSGHDLAGRGRTSPTGRYDGLCLVA